MNKEKNIKYINMNIYIRSEDAEYMREKLGREPVGKDLVEALLKQLSQKI